ncbi:MAG: TlpA family protein disulfide reductase [Pedobacter sp.]|nr:TlpA family protein disulfide reductase [Pedobacter sp.]
MKYLFLLILVSYASITGFTQEVSGTISNMQNRQLVFVSNDTFLKAKYDTVYPDEQGRFLIKFNFRNPGYVALWNINFEGRDLYVVPGSDLRIDADGTDNNTFLSTRKYSGSGADINNFIANAASPVFFQLHPISLETYKLDEDEFVSYIFRHYSLRDSLKSAWRSVLLKARRNDRVISDFIFTDSVSAVYDMTRYWYSYLNFSVKRDQRRAFFGKYIKPYANPIEDPRFLASPQYRWFWNRYVRQTSEYPIQGPQWMKYWIYLPQTIEKNLAGIVKRITAGSLEEALISQYATIPDSLSDALLRTSDFLLQTINEPNAITAYRHDIVKASEYRKISRIGLPAPDFSLVDSTGKKYSLSNFKGKAIYLDVWASWCGPCIEQFPAANILHEKFKENKNLVFLTVSVDNARKNWTKGLRLHSPLGMQLWAEGGFANAFTRSYGSTGLPHYVVIDKEGKIVNFKAPRPVDEPAISNLLNQILN